MQAEKCCDVIPLEGGAVFSYPKHSSTESGLAFLVGHSEYRNLVFATADHEEFDSWLSVLQQTISSHGSADITIARRKGLDIECCYSHLQQEEPAPQPAANVTHTNQQDGAQQPLGGDWDKDEDLPPDCGLVV